MTGGDPTRMNRSIERPEDIVDRIVPRFCFFATAPLMRGGRWTTFMWLLAGGKVVLLPGSFDGEEVWRTVEREQANGVTIVGDPMAVRCSTPGTAAGGAYDISSLMTIVFRRRPAHPAMKERFARTFQTSSWPTGSVRPRPASRGQSRFTGENSSSAFTIESSVVLDETTMQPVAPGSGQIGKVARTGRMPLRYHNDPEKTAATFVEVGGERYAVGGDMATVEADGTITLLGRGSQCINTGARRSSPRRSRPRCAAIPTSTTCSWSAHRRPLGSAGGGRRPAGAEAGRPPTSYESTAAARSRATRCPRTSCSCEVVPIAVGQGRLPLGGQGGGR